MATNIGGAAAIGPILKGMNQPVYLLQNSSDVNDIVNMTALAVTVAQDLLRNKHEEAHHASPVVV